jgi:ribonuclease D
LATLDLLAERPAMDAVFAVLRALALGRVLVHGGEHTFAILRRQLGLRFPRVIDTQQAATLIDLPRTGLRALALDLLGVVLPPVRSADWTRRPLTDDDVESATADARYLHDLWRRLEPRIAELDLDDELALASRLVEDPYLPPLVRTDNTPDPKRFRQIDGANRLPPEGLSVLAALVQWRDQKARELDLPAISLLSNAQLVDLASAPDKAIVRIDQMRFHSRLVHADRQSLRMAVVAAMSVPEEQAAAPQTTTPIPTPFTPPSLESRPPWVKKGPPDKATRARMVRLKTFRQAEATRRKVGLQAVLPAIALEHLAFFPDTPLTDVPGLGRRRIERYAAILAEILAA